jgi:chromosome segregation ATPase
MNILKTTGIVTLGAAMLISGGLYFNKGAIVERQEAAKAETTTDTSIDANAEDNFEVFSDEPLRAEEESAPADDTYPQSIPGIQAASRDVIALQQQIEGRMITCIQNAQRAQGTVAGLRQQEDRLRAQREVLNDRIGDVDSSTPEGRALRDRLQNERNALNNQLSQIRDRNNTERRNFNQYRSACRRDVNQLRNAQNRAENAIRRQFNQDIRVDYR